MPRIGLISDTHGLLRPQALAALSGCDYLVHAGDIGKAAILEQLRALAPLAAVRGNNDSEQWANDLPEATDVQVDNVRIYVLHDLTHLRINPQQAGFQVVVSGHSHRPSIEQRDGVLYVNPGSAGPRRFKLPLSVAQLVVARNLVSAKIIEFRVDEINSNTPRAAAPISASKSRKAKRP